MHKVLVIGNEETVLPFRAVGAEILVPAGGAEAESILQELESGDYGVIFLGEKIARDSARAVEALSKIGPPPIVTVMPEYPRTTGPTMSDAVLKDLIRQAVGIELPD